MTSSEWWGNRRSTARKRAIEYIASYGHSPGLGKAESSAASGPVIESAGISESRSAFSSMSADVGVAGAQSRSLTTTFVPSAPGEAPSRQSILRPHQKDRPL